MRQRSRWRRSTRRHSDHRQVKRIVDRHDRRPEHATAAPDAAASGSSLTGRCRDCCGFGAGRTGGHGYRCFCVVRLSRRSAALAAVRVPVGATSGHRRFSDSNSAARRFALFQRRSNVSWRLWRFQPAPHGTATAGVRVHLACDGMTVPAVSARAEIDVSVLAVVPGWSADAAIPIAAV